MGHKAYHKNKGRHGALRFLLVLVLTLCLLCVSVFAAFFVAARGPWDSFSAKLCGTLCEKNSVFTGVFFTSSEIKKASSYTIPAFSASSADTDRAYKTCGSGETLSGRGWKGFIAETDSVPYMAAGSAGDATLITLGLSSDTDMWFCGDTLSYRGEGGNEKYCFCAVNSDGILCAGGITAGDAVNGGFSWGISAERVLVLDGQPCSDPGGGYAARAALGQRQDGSFIFFSCESSGFYPCGISYEELTAIMYEYGAVTAVALKPAGGISAGAVQHTDTGTTPDFTLRAKVKSDAQ